MRPALSALAVAVVLGAIPGPGGAARAASGQDRLIELDQIAISHDVCGFPLSDAQSDALNAETDALVESLELDPADAQRLYDQYATAMRRQKASGLCDPKGEWARTYARLVAAFGRA